MKINDFATQRSYSVSDGLKIVWADTPEIYVYNSSNTGGVFVRTYRWGRRLKFLFFIANRFIEKEFRIFE